MGSGMRTGVLIVGGGFGGLFAAIKARENGAADVLVVDKGAAGRSGQSSLSAGATIYCLPEMGDDPEGWLRAIFLGREGLCRQDLVESYLARSGERLGELRDMGVEFAPGLDGEPYLRLPARGLEPGMMTVLPRYRNLSGGRALTAALRRKATGMGVSFLDKTFVGDLPVQDGRVVGAVGCHRRSGEFLVLQAGAVVMAAADCGFRGNYACVESATGDSFAMAYRAGAGLADMEMPCSNTAPPGYNFEGTGPACLLGAVFLNRKREDSLARYCPQGSLAEVNRIVQFMAREKEKGNGPPFYLDFTAIPARHPGLDVERAVYTNMGGRMPLNLRRLREEGITPPFLPSTPPSRPCGEGW